MEERENPCQWLGIGGIEQIHMRPEGSGHSPNVVSVYNRQEWLVRNKGKNGKTHRLDFKYK